MIQPRRLGLALLNAGVLAVLGLAVPGCDGGSSGPSGPPPATQLAVTVQPSTTLAGSTLAPVEVEVQDAAGNIASTASATVTLALAPNSGVQLSGTLTVPATSGVATFSDLQIDRPATGLVLCATASGLSQAKSTGFAVTAPKARHLIVLIADGWGYKQVEAANLYTGTTPTYQSWTSVAMSTWDLDTQQTNGGVGYDPGRAWTDFSYPTNAATDSAASGTAMFTGHKTNVGNISVSAGDSARLTAIGQLATARGMGTGTVTSVPLSHATPGTWYAHNDDRNNGFAIADEGLFGDPNTTGTAGVDPMYDGGWGPTNPRPDVIIGGGHPTFSTNGFVNTAIRDKLATESGQPGAWTLVERISGSSNGGARLLTAANDPATTRLVGLFGGSGGNIEYRLANGTGQNRENPTLGEMAQAALAVLERKSNGFVLMIEGGAVDWSGHSNLLDRCVGEMIDFNLAVQAVVAWVDDPANGSDWSNTLVVVTGDHECGFLTQAPGVFPDQPLGEVSSRTLGLERLIGSTGRRASWEDQDSDSEIDAGETVYWSWNSGVHSNSLIPVFARGAGSYLFVDASQATDPVRGAYMENTELFSILQQLLP